MLKVTLACKVWDVFIDHFKAMIKPTEQQKKKILGK